MGFFDFVSDCFSAVVDGLSGAASAVGSALHTMCSAIGSEGLAVIGSLAASILIPGVGLPELLVVVSSIADLVISVAKQIGLDEGDDSAEELGMKAEIADQKPEDFDSIEAYIQYLNEEVHLEKDAVENLSDENKVKYGAMGAAITIKGLEEKYHVELSPEFVQEAAEMDMKSEELTAYIDAFRESGLTRMQDLTDYLKGRETEGAKSEVSESMLDALKKLYPDLTEDDLEYKLADMSKE